MTPLADALADAREWLPRAAALTAIPDTAPTGPGGKPGSRPPWNQAAANVLWEGIGTVTEWHAKFAYLAHGRLIDPYPYAATGAALDAMERLAEAVPEHQVRQAVRDLLRVARCSRQLPANDTEERPQRITGKPCPYCELPMMMTLARAGIVYCKRGGFACWDANGDPPRGYVAHRTGPCVEWQDGLVT